MPTTSVEANTLDSDVLLMRSNDTEVHFLVLPILAGRKNATGRKCPDFFEIILQIFDFTQTSKFGVALHDVPRDTVIVFRGINLTHRWPVLAR